MKRPPRGLPAAGPLAVAAVVASLGAAVGCTGGDDPGPVCQDCNVVLVLVDTLRADHLGAYGYSRDTSPNLDAFAARETVLFEEARSQAACTYPSANSILTSRYPANFLGPGGMGIPEGIASLAEILDARGYTTLALSASPIVRKTPSQFNPDAGFGRGFDYFGEGCVWRKADCINPRIGRHLDGIDQPYFLYLHYMDPHSNYLPPQSHRYRFAKPYDGHDFIAKGNPNPIADMIYEDGPEVAVSDRDIEHLVDLYDEAIAFFDDRFPELLATLQAAGGWENTLFALVSDHGEEFLEHGHVKHCHSLYDTEIHTPFLLRVPGVEPGRVATPVGNIDLVPTFLDYLDIDAEGLGLEGRSLRSLLQGRGTFEPGVFSAQWNVRTLFTGRYKLLYRVSKERFFLYDLEDDPAESGPVRGRRPPELTDLRKRLLDWLERTEGDSADSIEAAREAERRLRSLGYL